MKIEFITQHNLFDDWLSGHFLSPLATLLWYRLVAINNKNGWIDWLQVGNTRLMDEINVTDKRSLDKYVNELIRNDLIQYKKGGKIKPPSYRICPLRRDKNGTIYPELIEVANKDTQNVTQLTTQKDTELTTQITTKNPANNAEFYVENHVTNHAENYADSFDKSLYINQDIDKTRQDETRQNKTESNDSLEAEAPSVRLDYAEFLEFWNENHRNMPKIKAITDKRKRNLRRLVDKYNQTQESILDTLGKAGMSHFLNGQNNRKWTATFDWITENPEHFMKVAEGNYDNRVPEAGKQTNTGDLSDPNSAEYQEFQDRIAEQYMKEFEMFNLGESYGE